MDLGLWNQISLEESLFGIASSKEALERQKCLEGNRFAVRPNLVAEFSNVGEWVYTEAHEGQAFYVETDNDGEWALQIRDGAWEWSQLTSPRFDSIQDMIRGVKRAKERERPAVGEPGVPLVFAQGWDSGMDKALKVMETHIRVAMAPPPEIGG